MKVIGKYVLSGIVTAIPLWVTWLVVEFVFGKLLAIGKPIVDAGRHAFVRLWPSVSTNVDWPLVDKGLAVVLTLAIFYCIGWAANHVFGRRFLEMIDNALGRVPLVKTIYGGVTKLISSLQGPPGAGQRVVLINFPSEEMKTVGLLTRIITETATGRKLAIVYVPTTPNPTSGYVEIVPIERVVLTDWTLDEAMNFIVSAGAVAPERPLKYAEDTHSPGPPVAVAETSAIR